MTRNCVWKDCDSAASKGSNYCDPHFEEIRKIAIRRDNNDFSAALEACYLILAAVTAVLLIRFLYLG